jgi:hypothetical protein
MTGPAGSRTVRDVNDHAGMTTFPSEGDLITRLWAEVAEGSVGGPSRRPELVVTGPTGLLPSAFAVEEVAVACVAAALLAAGALAGEHRPVQLDRAHVAAAVRSERYFRHDGRPAGAGFAPLSRFWPAADGWVRTHANYPWHKAALLRAVDATDDPEAVARAIRALPAAVVEERVFAAGGVAAAVRDAATWRAHPQGGAVSVEPLVGHRVVGGAPPRPRAGGADLPVAGIRVLDLTRVIAGPVCTRFVGALGAEVLRLDPPRHPDVRRGAVADTLLAKRSAALDLDAPAGPAALHALLDGADAVVCGYRPGSLDRFGLDPDALGVRHPGLVAVYLDAWGHTGPWAARRGFDSVVQAATGIATAASSDGVAPGALPCQLLDHGTGYLAAAAVLDGLRRQRAEGGTHVRQLSLARTSAWLMAGASEQPPAPDGGTPGDLPDASAWIVELDGEPGSIEAVAPPGTVGGRPLAWPGPPARYLEDPPAWAEG